MAATLLLGLGMTASSGWAQLSPSGYTGAINTPTADTLPAGHAELTLSNSIPEKPRAYPGTGAFGGFNLGLGVARGLELVGRLSFDGDLQCNLYLSDCRSWTRDLSMGGKWQLPVALPLGSRVAVGVSDYGGAATQFRQTYAVLTSRPENSPFSISVGRSKGDSPHPLMNGWFGSVSAQMRPGLSAVLENDSRETRAGLKGQLSLHPRLSLVLAGSRKLTRNTEQQAGQVSLGLLFALEQPVHRQAIEREAVHQSFYPPLPVPVISASTRPAPVASAQPLQAQAASTGPGQESTLEGEAKAIAASTAENEDARATASLLSKALVSAGFADISIGLEQAGSADERRWVVQAEPLSWRKSRHEALGKILSLWLDQKPGPREQLTVVLTYLRQATLAARTTGECLRDFQQGHDQCSTGAALALLEAPGQAVTADTQWLQRHVRSSLWRPRLAFAPNMVYAVGTEYGLTDYALALDTGWEWPLARGLVWQGFHTTPLAHSDDYAPGHVFAAGRQPRIVQTSMLSYVTQPMSRVWLQASTGLVTPEDRGSQLDLRWLPGDGRLRLSTTIARYQRELLGYTVEPRVVQARWSVVPGRWTTELTAGRFFMHDEGFRLSTTHWFDDYRVSFYYRQTQSPGGVRMPLTKFAGFSITIPLGARESAQLGPVNLRFRDNWSMGLETKVGAKDNYITGGYGVLPVLRHGMNDVTDFDRTGPADFWAQRHRIRSAMD